jgi:hypothetical protein
MNDVVNAPHDRGGEREYDKKRQQNGEAQRDRLRKPGFKPLLEGPDKCHAEKRKRDRFKHDARKIERRNDQGYCEESLNAPAKLDAARPFRFVAHLRRTSGSILRFVSHVVLLGCAMSSKQQPKAQREDNDFNQHREDQPHQA